MQPIQIDILQYGIVSFASFVAGIVLGWFSRGFIDKNIKNKDSGNTLVLIIVSLVWMTSVLVDIVSPTYETSPLLHGLMGAIVGFFYKPVKKEP